MILIIRSVAFMVLLIILFSGVVCGAEVTGVEGNLVKAGTTVNGIYYGDTMVKDGPRNLIIGGIQQAGPDPKDNPDYENFANDKQAIYVPTYYSRYVYPAPVGKSPGELINGFATGLATITYDSIQVNKAALGEATDMNGLTSPALKNQQYDTIISYSGGTATAVTALKSQGVKCDTLVLVSPMKGTLSDTNYKNEIMGILNSGAVNHIVVIWSPEDTPTIFPDLYQAHPSSSWDLKNRITVSRADLLNDIYDGIQAHKDIFFKFAKDHLKLPNQQKFSDASAAGVSVSSKTSPTDALQSSAQGTSSAAGDAFSVGTPQSQVSSDSTPNDGADIYQEPITQQASQSTELGTNNPSAVNGATSSTSQNLQPTNNHETTPSTVDTSVTDISQGLQPNAQAKVPTINLPPDESNTKEGSVIPTLYPTTSPPPDESNTKEGSVIPTLYPTTSPPPDESNTKESSTVQANDLSFGSVQRTAQNTGLSTTAAKAALNYMLDQANTNSVPYKSTIPTPIDAATQGTPSAGFGGINFTSIKLSYISVNKNSSGGINFDYLFKAQKADGTNPNAINSTLISTTAFMTGLAVPDNKFWVNLNPWEQDRIIDEQLIKSDVGRIMLEADFQMKRDFSNYGNPCANETGKALWNLLDKKQDTLTQQCMQKFPGEIKDIKNVHFMPVTRHWIVPDKVYAYTNGTQIYIINATLTINSEPVANHSSFRVDNQDIGTISNGCLEELNKSAREYGEYAKELEDRMTRPYVVADVNHGGKYEDLRNVYVALALAQWYKSRVSLHVDVFRDRLNSPNSTVLVSQRSWSPNEIWDNYVYSFKNGEYKCWDNTTTKTAKGNHTETRSCSAGGVDFYNIKDHLIEINRLPPEIQDQVDKAIRYGFINGEKDMLFGNRLHADMRQDTPASIYGSGTSPKPPESLDSKQEVHGHPNESKTDSRTVFHDEKPLGQSKGLTPVAKDTGNTTQITCPKGWNGPDKNGECRRYIPLTSNVHK